MPSDDLAAEIEWEGDSLAVLRSFPKTVRSHLGADLRRVQIGEKPYDSRPMRSNGKGAFELRQQDARSWHRVVYLARIENTSSIVSRNTRERRRNAIWRLLDRASKTF
jgi:phage-related protein